jgi:uncharacterized membrane protein YeaQ/YmgE (transglycosylase-associated protein family)
LAQSLAGSPAYWCKELALACLATFSWEIVGAIIAGVLFPRLGIGLTLGGGIVGAIVTATIGAVILLLIVRVIHPWITGTNR